MSQLRVESTKIGKYKFLIVVVVFFFVKKIRANYSTPLKSTTIIIDKVIIIS